MFRMRINFAGGVTGASCATHYFNDPLGATAVTAARTALNALYIVLTPYIHTSCTWSFDTEAEEVDVLTGHITDVLAVGPGSAPGTGSGDILPFATQGLIRWRTGQYRVGGTKRPTSKEIRGRTFVPAMTETNNTSGKPTTAMATAINTGLSTYLAAAGVDPAVYSKVQKGGFSISTAALWSEWAQLRSRRD